MTMASVPNLRTYQERYQYDGYAVVPGLFSPDEVTQLADHYMALRAQGPQPGDFAGVNATSTDPLKKYPRMIHMHRWDERSLQWLIDVRLNQVMTALLGAEPYAVQTMLYFKPPGARGQALHQDQSYLRVQPGTCMAAWMALDRCDEENGCMQVVPGSHTLPLLCTTKADTTQSFTDVTVPMPESMHSVPVIMNPGDVFFFNGQVIHGSYPNQSKNRFRRSLIGHYIVGEAEKVAKFFHPVLRMDGSEVQLDVSEQGGPCGVWVERDGETVVEMVAVP
ncbi:MAG: phytanoyl-CoA dioxygenase family protein [Caldilineaceae bacterium]|nr:phytanoyl-CoA dioxygenase family protein [Caldilineaceae bacterium]MCB0120985.1 phytanoyl-CoA dioxygenase family protein [Caldilineaceae bacterium]